MAARPLLAVLTEKCDHRLEIPVLDEKANLKEWHCQCGKIVKSCEQLEQEKALNQL